MRQQVRASVQQFHALPEDRQRLVKKAFRDCGNTTRTAPAMMNSSQSQAQFSPQDRGILGNILAVEPYQPVPRSGLDGNGLQYGH